MRHLLPLLLFCLLPLPAFARGGGEIIVLFMVAHPIVLLAAATLVMVLFSMFFLRGSWIARVIGILGGIFIGVPCAVGVFFVMGNLIFTGSIALFVISSVLITGVIALCAIGVNRIAEDSFPAPVKPPKM